MCNDKKTTKQTTTTKSEWKKKKKTLKNLRAYGLEAQPELQ